MARITTYTNDITISDNDKLIGTDADNSDATKNFKISDLKAYMVAGLGTVSSVALTMPAAFSVTGSPITSTGTLAVTGAGTSSQVILGDGTLGSLPGGPFLPLAGGTMVGNTLHGDNVKSIYGTGSDLEIFFDGTNSNIQETAAAVGTLQFIANQAVAIKTTSTTNLLTGGAGNDTELSDTNGVTRLALTTSNAIFPSGSVGIGTTSPSELLHINGGGATIRIKNSTAGSGTSSVVFETGMGYASSWNLDASNKLHYTSNHYAASPTKVVTISGFNNHVGIGQENPASRLTVTGGDAEVTGSSNGLILESPDGTRYRVKVDNSGNLTTATV